MAEQRARPLSPHLGIWRWGPGMAASIFHRISGGGLTVVGLAVLTWWLLALAKGADAYGDFVAIAKTWVGVVVLIGLTWAFFQHLFSESATWSWTPAKTSIFGPTRRLRSSPLPVRSS